MKTDEGYELIKGLIETGAANDPKVRSLLDRIAKGDADFKTTTEYSRIVSEILGTSLSEHILDLDGEAREEVCRMLLHDRYEDINDVLAEVQTSLDAKTGINIRPKKPPFQSERVASFAHSLADLTVADQVIKRRAKNGSANISMSDHDRYMKANAELRNKAGLKCYIERETDGKCCEWCTKMAGRYAYPDDTPKDVFRRHDNCGCSVTYKNGRQRQDVWSKKTWEADKDERISKASGKEPTVFTKADAQAKQSEILARRELTSGEKSGTMTLNRSVTIPDSYVFINSVNNNFNKFSDQELSLDILTAIENTIAKQKADKSDFFFTNIYVGKFDAAHEKSVFITDVTERGSSQTTTLYLNSRFFVGTSKADFDSMCKAMKDDGWWQSECLEDLVNHEIIHARLAYYNGVYKTEQMEQLLADNEKIKGFCKLVDQQPGEFMNEVFVALKRGEKIDKQYLDIYYQYAKEYLGGNIYG